MSKMYPPLFSELIVSIFIECYAEMKLLLSYAEMKRFILFSLSSFHPHYRTDGHCRPSLVMDHP